MSSSKQAYLAAHYMSGPKADAILARASDAPEKKKKKKKSSQATTAAGASTSASFIRDDDAGWGAAGSGAPVGADDMDEVAKGDAIVASDRSFKKRTAGGGGGWETIRAPTPPPADEMPQVVDDAPLTGGLLSGAQLKKFTGAKNDKPAVKPRPEEEETVHRDSSGRKIDTKAERAVAARERREREEKEAQKMEWGKGLVQREEREKARLELEKEKTRGLSRYANDAELNAEQKAQERWNDPAAAFLTKNRSSGPRKPEYSGPPPPPNRFGIKPGYRWDGVDRSNGFEKKLFQRGNERQRRGLEAYEWSVDDM